MIYSNMHLKSVLTEFEFGNMSSIVLGESDEHGRNFVHLICCDNTTISKGLNKNMSISFSLRNNPKIVNRKDDNLFMLLSTKGGSTLKGNGVVLVPQENRDQFKVIARARGGDVKFAEHSVFHYRTGYLAGYWDHLLIQVPTDDAILQVRTSGGMYGDPPCDIYLIHNGYVFHCNYKNLENVCLKHGFSPPCEIYSDSWGNTKLSGSWVRL